MTTQQEYEDLYGKVTSSEYDGYWKYKFTLLLTTSKGYIIRATYGGSDHDDIYRFSPEDVTWDDIEDAGEIYEVVSSPPAP